MLLSSFIQWVDDDYDEDSFISPEARQCIAHGVMPVRMYVLGDSTYITFDSRHRLPQAASIAQLYCKRAFGDGGVVVDAEDYEWKHRFTVSFVDCR